MLATVSGTKVHSPDPRLRLHDRGDVPDGNPLLYLINTFQPEIILSSLKLIAENLPQSSVLTTFVDNKANIKMLRHAVAIIAILLTYVLADARPPICDLPAARQYCDTTTLQRIEGIWKMTDSDTQLLISRDDTHPLQYAVTILRAEDARLLPGDTLAVCHPSADPDRFTITFRTGMKWDAKCLATLTDSDLAISIQRPQRRIKLSPYMFLRHFWGLFRYESKNPVEQITQGLIKLYPRGYDQQSSPFNIRYL